VKNTIRSMIKTCLVAGVLFAVNLSTMITATEPTMNNEEIAQYILDQLGYEENQNLLYYVWGPVSEGETILTTNGPLYEIPCKGYVMYIDLHPQANMFHPVQYVFLAEQTQELLVFDVTTPPLNFHEYLRIETPFSDFFYSVENRRAPLPCKTEPTCSAIGRDDSRWAVLMNGGYDRYNNHVRYWNDLSNIYITLNYVYEIPDENIIVLCSDGTDPAVDQSNGQNSNPDLDGDGDPDIMYSCILSNVNMVFANLANNFTGTEKLFVFTTDHGSSVSGWNVVQNLWNHEVLTDAHFASLLAALPVSEIICTFEPCFSGGFLDDVVVPPGPVVASSACRHDESSWAMDNLLYDEYVFYWTAAVKGADAYGNPVDADINDDGVVTMDEAFIYAEDHDTRPESPQYGDYPEGTGSYLSLWVTSDPPAQPSRPDGPTLGIWHAEYSYSSSTTEPDNEQIYYRFDWDDGSNSGWLGPYSSGETVTGSHIWTELGTYNVTVKARDVWGAGSVLSEPLTVVITDNTPPDTPTITGPTTVKPNVEQTYTLSGTDLQNQDLTYYIDWGDGNAVTGLGPYHSGETFTLTHTWKTKGTYLIKTRTTDTCGATSEWASIEVVAPVEYRFSLSAFFERLLELFPRLFPVLRNLMEH
jgi:hypothetical protein